MESRPVPLALSAFTSSAATPRLTKHSAQSSLRGVHQRRCVPAPHQWAVYHNDVERLSPAREPHLAAQVAQHREHLSPFHRRLPRLPEHNLHGDPPKWASTMQLPANTPTGVFEIT